MGAGLLAISAAMAALAWIGSTPEERDIYRRGRTAHPHAVPKNATAKEYARATGLECLFGHLFLEGKTQRINQLFVTVMEELYGI